MSKPTPVLHIIDTLESGGLERMAVNLVNHLPKDRFQSFLCITLRDGPLLEHLAPHVIRLQLSGHTVRFGMMRLKALVKFIREYNIKILHAHGPLLFEAILGSLFPPFPIVLWHVHSGRFLSDDHAPWPHRLLRSRIKGVIAVNQALADWSSSKLGVCPAKVSYIPNFVVTEDQVNTIKKTTLPGSNGMRIACLANLRPEKDHITLLHAFALVIQQIGNSHLFLIGSTTDDSYLEIIQKTISKYQLEKYVSLLGHRSDVMRLLGSCDVGVLSSISEGFPMALLEYGMVGLSTVATQVGQCPEVLNYGEAGILVPPRSPSKLAEALLELLRSPNRRGCLGKRLTLHVKEKFTSKVIIEKFCLFYERMLNS